MTRDELVRAVDSLVYLCHRTSVLHGFHDYTPENPFNLGEKVALIHSELSEGFEGFRQKGLEAKDEHCPQHKNFAVELADTVIRVFDLAGYLNLDLGAVLLDKMDYNEHRPYKHGKSF